MPRNKVEVCAHCGRPGVILCNVCLNAGHTGTSMFSCGRCVNEWLGIEAQIARVCCRGPSVVQPLDDVRKVG